MNITYIKKRRPQWKPLNMPNLFFWFDADAITGKNDGDSLSTLSDSSGNSRNLTGSGATYETNEINGKAVARFTADSYSSSRLNASGSKVGCYLVCTRNTDAINAHFIAFGNWNPDGVFMIGSSYDLTPVFIVYNSNSIRIVELEGSSAGSALPTTATLIGFRADVNAGTFQSRRNGSTISNLTNLSNTTSTLNTSNSALYTTFGGSNCRGDIAEILIVMGEVSDSNRDKIEGYLAHKWGLTSNLPNNHPYKNTRPYQ